MVWNIWKFQIHIENCVFIIRIQFENQVLDMMSLLLAVQM